MTLLDYYEGISEAKRLANCQEQSVSESPLTIEQLSYRYGSYVLAMRKKKGAGKGYKESYKWQWSNYRGYMNELRELFPTEYALQLCRDEHSELMTDRWWDVPSYRAEHLRIYRSRITAIRREYGLRSADVCEFMRV